MDVLGVDLIRQTREHLLAESGGNTEIAWPQMITALGESCADAFSRINKSEIKRVQLFVTSDTFQAPRPDVAKVLQKSAWLDESWQAAFEIMNMTGSNKGSFTVRTLDDTALTFKQREDTEETEIYTLSGTEVTVSMPEYSAGMYFSYKALDDQDDWNVARTARAFGRAAFKKRHGFFYDLLSAARADSDVAYQQLSDTEIGGQLARDIATIEEGISQILEALVDTEVEVGTESVFLLYTRPGLLSRAKRAAAATLVATTGDTELHYNITVVNTLNLKNQALTAADSTHWLLVLGGGLNLAGIRMLPTTMSEVNASKRGETVFVHQRFGGAIAAAQMRRLATSD